MSFKDMVESDIKNVFLNADEFAENLIVIYDGESYGPIPVVLTKLKEQDKKTTVRQGDHSQGIYLDTTVMHCALSDLGGVLPEKGSRIKIQDEPNSSFYRSYYVAVSDIEMGMIRAELEEHDE